MNCILKLQGLDVSVVTAAEVTKTQAPQRDQPKVDKVVLQVCLYMLIALSLVVQWNVTLKFYDLQSFCQTITASIEYCVGDR